MIIDHCVVEQVAYHGRNGGHGQLVAHRPDLLLRARKVASASFSLRADAAWLSVTVNCGEDTARTSTRPMVIRTIGATGPGVASRPSRSCAYALGRESSNTCVGRSGAA